MAKIVEKAKVKIQLLNSKAKMPTCGSKSSAGYDLYSICDEVITVGPHETVKMKTGIALEIPEGYAGLIYARSGIATKRGLAPANKVGVIDSDYRGEVKIAVINHGNESFVIENGDRIAQLVIMQNSILHFCLNYNNLYNF